MLYCRKLLAERPLPSKMKFLTYLRYILCFKLWKKLILSSSLGSCNKRKEIEQIRLILRGLNPPRDFMSQHEKYNWSNWPKLTMSSNGTMDSIERDLKNVTFVLYGAKLLIKECYKVNFILNYMYNFQNFLFGNVIPVKFIDFRVSVKQKILLFYNDI